MDDDDAQETEAARTSQRSCTSAPGGQPGAWCAVRDPDRSGHWNEGSDEGEGWRLDVLGEGVYDEDEERGFNLNCETGFHLLEMGYR